MTIETQGPFIRMMLDGYLDAKKISNTGIRYIKWSATSKEQGRETVLLRPIFNEVSQPFFSTQLVQNIERQIQKNGETVRKGGKYGYSSFELARLPKLCLNEHPEVFYRLAQAYEGTFTDWENLMIDDNTFDPQKLQDLPELSTADYLSNITVCEVIGETLNAAKQQMYLPVDADELFNAMAIAQDQAALLSFSKPETLTQMPVKLKISKPFINTRAAQKTMKIGSS